MEYGERELTHDSLEAKKSLRLYSTKDKILPPSSANLKPPIKIMTGAGAYQVSGTYS